MSDFKPLGTLIHGCALSEHVDSSGERLSVKGIDITSLPVDGLLNYEHKNEVPNQVVGKILKAKKIFQEEDCSTKEEMYFWNKVQAPFVYIVGELFDGVGHEGAKQVASMFKYDTQARQAGRDSKNVMNFSVEGAKLGKDGQNITSSLARKVTITTLPCNKMAIAEELVIEPEVTSIKKSENTELQKNDQLSTPKKKALPWWASGPSDVSAFKDQKKRLMVEDRRKKMTPRMAAPGAASLPKPEVQGGPSSLKPNKVFSPDISGKIDYKGIKKTLTAGSGMGAPDTKTQGDALTSSHVEKDLQKLPQFKTFLKFIQDKYPEMNKSESDAFAKYLTARSMIKAEEALEKMANFNPKITSSESTHIHPKYGKVKHLKTNKTDKGPSHVIEIMEGEHKGKWTQAEDSELRPISKDLDKSKNVREQKKKIFGTDANAPRLSDRRMKMMQQIRDFAEKKFGLPFVTAEGKRDASGKMREDKENQPAFDVYTPEGQDAERKLLARQKKKGIKRVDPRPDWRSGRLESQPSPAAAVHEAAHLYLAPEGMTPAIFQEHMDKLWGESQSKYGHMQQKRTSGEIQPMSVENPIRRELGIPANRTTKPVKRQETALDYKGDRFVEGKDPKGRKAFYDRQSRLMTPETKERVEQVREGSLKFHPQKGWYKDSSPDSLINLRGRGLKDEASSRQQERYSAQAQPKKMAASEMSKGSMYKRCWEGYKPVPGKKPYSEGSCAPIKKSSEQPKAQYAIVPQGWRDKRLDHASGKMVNPVTDQGKNFLTHVDDINALNGTPHLPFWHLSDEPKTSHGYETYQIHPTGELKLVGRKHDTSD